MYLVLRYRTEKKNDDDARDNDVMTVFRKTEQLKNVRISLLLNLKVFWHVTPCQMIINTYRRDLRYSGMLCGVDW